MKSRQILLIQRIVIICVLLFFSLSAHAKISVRFQPATVPVGQSAQLIFTAEEPFSQQPDLSALKTDFEIAGSQTSFSTTIINGKKQSQYNLIFNVLPLKTGQLSLPALSIDGQTTNPTTLTVAEHTTQNIAIPDISFSADLIHDTIYIGESTIYAATLNETTDLISAEIRAPQLNDATIEQFSSDTTNLTYQGTKPIHQITRTYLIIPTKTGTQTIQPARFIGKIPAKPNPNESLSPFGNPLHILFADTHHNTQDLILTAQPLTLTVLPKPADYGMDWWLPTRQLSFNLLKELPTTGSVGDPITLFLEISALGIDAEELPEFQLSDTQNFKIYQNPAQRQNYLDAQDRFTGRLAQEINLIPLKSGTHELPFPTIPWFNTKTEQKEIARLPTHTIDIKQSEIVPTPTQPTQPTPETIPVETKENTLTPTQPAENKPFFTPELKKQSLKWGSTIAFILLIVFGGLFVFFFIRKKRRSKKRLPDLYPY